MFAVLAHHLPPLDVPLLVPHAAVVASYEEGILAVLLPAVWILLKHIEGVSKENLGEPEKKHAIVEAKCIIGRIFYMRKMTDDS